MTSFNKISGKIVNHDGALNGEIVFNENILQINDINESTNRNYIIPGFVDLHCHGGVGYDTMEGANSIKKMSEYHLSKGTTSLLATTWTSTFDHTYDALNGFNDLLGAHSNLIGVHLEGPFINSSILGAQPALTSDPSIEFINKVLKFATIKTITLAPELEGMETFIPYLREKKINVQFGHSLADSKCCEKYINKNNTSFTHLYNAMSGNNHRSPGVLSTALSKGIFAEIICDMNHVSKEAILIAKKCIPNLYAITDSIGASGLDDGNYKFAHTDIEKIKDKVFLQNTNTLAGSVTNMHDSFLNLLKMNISIEDAVKMTSFSAAKYLNLLNVGSISKNNKANFLVLDKDFNILKIFLNGQLIHA
tara:strand:+ start:1375 stop:2466 length:1092 start_codon:yes stop_codon:yes gene_type:complete